MDSTIINQKTQNIFSGIQPTGVMTLGNYIGAIKNWVELQSRYNCVYSVVDMHSLTIHQDPKILRENSLRCFALLIAAGIDPEKSTLFIQSHVHTHAELSWLLSCYTPYGELLRQIQFKEKSQKSPENINAGLLTYPVLQAADILLYQASLVPIGADQKQHLELSRNIAIRFNGLYGNTFKVPEPLIPKEGGKVMSLADPAKKMSKSDANPKGFISILDSADVIIKKFKSAVTDSDNRVAFENGNEGISNLMTIYSLMTGSTNQEIEKEFCGKGYGDFKLAVGQAVASNLAPVQKNFERLMNDRDYLVKAYRNGSQKAMELSSKTLNLAYKKVGFLEN